MCAGAVPDGAGDWSFLAAPLATWMSDAWRLEAGHLVGLKCISGIFVREQDLPYGGCWPWGCAGCDLDFSVESYLPASSKPPLLPPTLFVRSVE